MCQIIHLFLSQMNYSLKLVYHLTPGNGQAIVQLVSTLRHSSYNITVNAYDLGSPALSSSVILLIQVEEVIRSRPHFDSDFYEVDLWIHSPVGTTVISFADDYQSHFIYSILGTLHLLSTIYLYHSIEESHGNG